MRVSMRYSPALFTLSSCFVPVKGNAYRIRLPALQRSRVSFRLMIGRKRIRSFYGKVKSFFINRNKNIAASDIASGFDYHWDCGIQKPWTGFFHRQVLRKNHVCRGTVLTWYRSVAIRSNLHSGIFSFQSGFYIFPVTARCA